MRVNREVFPVLAAAFEALAEELERHAAAAVVQQRLEALHAHCQQAVRDRSLGSTQLLINVSTAVQTWREVWPRLGGQAPFRQAVTREAGLWAQQFREQLEQP
jgi:hypothetical protein